MKVFATFQYIYIYIYIGDNPGTHSVARVESRRRVTGTIHLREDEKN